MEASHQCCHFLAALFDFVLSVQQYTAHLFCHSKTLRGSTAPTAAQIGGVLLPISALLNQKTMTRSFLLRVLQWKQNSPESAA